MTKETKKGLGCQEGHFVWTSKLIRDNLVLWYLTLPRVVNTYTDKGGDGEVEGEQRRWRNDMEQSTGDGGMLRRRWRNATEESAGDGGMLWRRS